MWCVQAVGSALLDFYRESVSGPDDAGDLRKYSFTNESASVASGKLTVEQSAAWDPVYRKSLVALDSLYDPLMSGQWCPSGRPLRLCAHIAQFYPFFQFWNICLKVMGRSQYSSISIDSIAASFPNGVLGMVADWVFSNSS